MIEINVVAQQKQLSITAGTGAADTAGGSLAGATSTTQETADATTPESQRQYDLRDIADKLPVKGIYAQPCVWGDIAYWMDF